MLSDCCGLQLEPGPTSAVATVMITKPLPSRDQTDRPVHVLIHKGCSTNQHAKEFFVFAILTNLPEYLFPVQLRITRNRVDIHPAANHDTYGDP